MIYGGLVSVTFRKLDPVEIVGLVKNSALDAIEWGGDIHVPHGNIKRAAQVRVITADAGLKVASYGSYYRVGESEMEGLPFYAVLETALELGAPTIRVWAGKKGSKNASFKYRLQIAEDTLRIAELSKTHGVNISFEFHSGTLTDSNDSTVSLMEDIKHENVFFYWQPLPSMTHDDHLSGLTRILRKLSNIHVYHWLTEDQGLIRKPLSEGKRYWKEFLTTVAKNSSRNHFALLEFVKGDSPEQLLADAKILNKLIGDANKL